MERNALSHMARGADAILFFQWRASRRGAEKFHSAMLPHAGTSSRVFREIVELGGTTGALSEVLGSEVTASAAILWDWESLWAQELEWHPSVDLAPRQQVRRYYDRLWRDKVTTDLVHPRTDLSFYQVVLAPASYLLTEDSAANLRAYVEQGGHLVVGPFSGVVDQDDAVHPGGLNGALSDLLGVVVEEHLPLREDVTVQLTGAIPARIWTEDLACGARTRCCGTWTARPPEALPSPVTRWRRYRDLHLHRSGGSGSGRRAGPVLQQAQVLVRRDLPWDLELVTRSGPEHSYLFAINHATRRWTSRWTASTWSPERSAGRAPRCRPSGSGSSASPEPGSRWLWLLAALARAGLSSAAPAPRSPVLPANGALTMQKQAQLAILGEVWADRRAGGGRFCGRAIASTGLGSIQIRTFRDQ